MSDPRRPLVLIVEDEESLAELLRVNLEAAGYSVLVAPNGVEGLDLFRSSQPDLVTLDLKLPDVSGFRLLDLFKRDTKHSPMVIVVTSLDYAEAGEAIRSGADDFMTKPFEPAELIERIQYLLQKRSAD